MLALRCPLGLSLMILLALASNLLAQEPAAESQDDEAAAIDWTSRDFWETSNGGPVPEGWRFENGEVALASPRKGGGNIFSPPLPPNFELTWKWKIEKGVNSGLKYRVRRFGNQESGRHLGVEYQIIDSKPDATSKGATAAIYDLVGTVKEKTLHPPGQWNSARVVAVGDRLEHYLNGKLVAATTTTGPAWETKIAFSKFYGYEDFGRPKTGDRIMLTDHGGKVAYKDFQFVAVDPPPAEPVERTGPFLANASRNSWADQESIVIWTRTTKQPQMLVDGKKFVSINTKEARELAKRKDAEHLLRVQLPEGAELDEMFGACPGAAGKVRLSYFPGQQRNRIQHTDWVSTSEQNDFTAQWKLEGLKPGTKYTTIIEARTADDRPAAVTRGAFRTAPKTNATETIRFCITTCHDFIRRDDGLNGHKIYGAMSKIRPDFVVHAGDIEYYDKPDPWALTKQLMRFKWSRIFSLPANRDFYHHTTSYFIKDDHDTLSNDSWPGKTYGSVSFAEGVQLFNEEQFPTRNPRYANVRWGRDLEIWILEGRDYRSPNNLPDGPEKTILGAEQKAWLFRTLKASKARFKLILSPTPIVGPDRKNKKDNHANDVFAHEGAEVREQLSAVPGVIVFCGDRHWQYASVDEETGLWEFGCGPGSERHQLGWKAGDERPTHRFLRVKGGFLSGLLKYDAKGKESTLTIRHHSVTGEPVSEFVFPVEEAEKVENDSEEKVEGETNVDVKH